MSIFTLWPSPEVTSNKVITVADGIKTKANAVLTGCSTEHPVNSDNLAECCNQILTAVNC